jgi:DNA-directed RNA polymerase subunit RPC12/RpoP
MDEKLSFFQANEEMEFFTVDEPASDSSQDQAPPASVPMAQPIRKKTGDEFKCPECGKIFIVALKKRPLHIRCPYCGLEGMVD